MYCDKSPGRYRAIRNVASLFFPTSNDVTNRQHLETLILHAILEMHEFVSEIFACRLISNSLGLFILFMCK